MKTTFKVEIPGHEYSVYGGAAGDYCGTTVSENQVMDFLELSEDKYGDMKVSIFEDKVGDIRVELLEHREYLYWAPSYYRYIVEPGTGRHGIKICKDLLDKVIFAELGWKEYNKGHFDEYWKVKRSWMTYAKITVKELQDILKSL